MFNSGRHKVDQSPVFYFEAIAHKDKVLEKTLRAVDDISFWVYIYQYFPLGISNLQMLVPAYT